MKIKNEAGEEVEVFSQEEANALVATKAEEAATAERERLEAEHQAKLDEAEEEKAELEKKLKGFQDKDYNFNQLRNKKEKEDESSKKVLEQLSEVSQEIAILKSQPFEKIKADFIATNNIAADKELSEKFDYFFKPLQGQAKTEADLKAALTGAFAAATGGTKQPSFEGIMVSTRITPPSNGEKQTTQAAVEIGFMLGISDADRKAHATAPATKFGHKK